jgi:hypothetical protein
VQVVVGVAYKPAALRAGIGTIVDKLPLEPARIHKLERVV